MAPVLEDQGVTVICAGEIVNSEQRLDRAVDVLQPAALPLYSGFVKGNVNFHARYPSFYLVAHIIPACPGHIQKNRQTVHAASASSRSIRSLARRAYSSVTSMPVAV